MENTVFWIFLISTWVVEGVYGQSVQMDAGCSGYVGARVDLRCLFINSVPPVKVSQVTWQKLANGSKQNVAIVNPALGVSVLPAFRDRVSFKSGAVRRRNPSLDDTTISISSLRLSDEAAYICEYTTFPAGNREGTVNLTVNARPTILIRLSDPILVAGSSNVKIPVATCLSANGKPPGTIRWDTALPGEATVREVRNHDGTVTVESDYVMVPRRETHLETLTCVTMYNDEVLTDSVTLDIQYEPYVSVEGFDGNWYLNRRNVRLVCKADANPAADLYQWRWLNGSLPSSVEVRDNVLVFRGPVTYRLAGTYVCDASNSLGTASASVDVSVTEKPVRQVGRGDVLSVVGLLLIAGLVLIVAITVLVVSRRKQLLREADGDSSTDSGPSLKMAPPTRKNPNDDLQPYSGKFYEELPNHSTDYVSYRLACSKEDYAEPYSPPINPPLSFLPQHPYPPSQHSTASPFALSSSSNNTFCPPPHNKSPVFRYPSVPGLAPPPGVAPYTFPKEQYV